MYRRACNSNGSIYSPSKVFNTNNPANQPSTISPPPVRSNVPYYYQYNLQYSIIYTTK